PRQDPEQRRLPRPVRSDQPQRLAAMNLEIHLQHETRIGLSRTLDDDRRFAHLHLPLTGNSPQSQGSYNPPMSWAENTTEWKPISPRSSALFLAGVFALFGSFGFITANMGFERPDPIAASIAAVVYGAFGMAWAFAGTRRIVWMMIALGFAQW